MYEEGTGKKDFYNQRQRWLATQFSNLFSGIFKMPVAMLKGKWDYCDKLFQWMMPPRVLLLGFIILIAIILTVLHPHRIYKMVVFTHIIRHHIQYRGTRLSSR